MSINNEKTQLQKVFCHKWYDVLSDDVEEIYIVTDGHGSMGFYDRVHVVFYKDLNEGGLIFPAHHCEQMKLLHVPQQTGEE